eukprot:scaffold54107_cov30-Tisochrysis_lutea.AAC.1
MKGGRERGGEREVKGDVGREGRSLPIDRTKGCRWRTIDSPTRHIFLTNGQRQTKQGRQGRESRDKRREDATDHPTAIRLLCAKNK